MDLGLARRQLLPAAVEIAALAALAHLRATVSPRAGCTHRIDREATVLIALHVFGVTTLQHPLAHWQAG